MRFFTIVVLIAIITGLPLATHAVDNVRKISVTGRSETVVEPQSAIIRLSVRYVNNEMGLSHRKLQQTLSKLTEGLKGLNIPDADIKKSSIVQGKEYSWADRGRIPTGYFSECFIDLNVRNAGGLAGVYGELARYDGVIVHDTEFRRNDELEIRQAELEKALRIARKKAEQIARTLDVKVGGVYSIQEISDIYDAAKIFTNTVVKAEGGGGSRYGYLKITAVVKVEFELQ